MAIAYVTSSLGVSFGAAVPVSIPITVNNGDTVVVMLVSTGALGAGFAISPGVQTIQDGDPQGNGHSFTERIVLSQFGNFVQIFSTEANGGVATSNITLAISFDGSQSNHGIVLTYSGVQGIGAVTSADDANNSMSIVQTIQNINSVSVAGFGYQSSVLATDDGTLDLGNQRQKRVSSIDGAYFLDNTSGNGLTITNRLGIFDNDVSYAVGTLELLGLLPRIRTPIRTGPGCIVPIKSGTSTRVIISP